MHLWRSGGAVLYFDAVWIGHHTDLYRPHKPKTGKTMIYKYKNHKIIKTDTTTDVYVKASIGYRSVIRNLYMVKGEFETSPEFTTIARAKEWITEQIEKKNLKQERQ